MKTVLLLVLICFNVLAINVDGFAQVSASKEIKELEEGSNIG
jgi:hypothetical protein